MAQTVEHALQDWATHASDAELAAGPTLDALGGPAAVLAEALDLATGPHLPYLMQALAHASETLSEPQATTLLDAIHHGLAHPHAAWVLADALDILFAAPALHHLAAATARTLADHAEAALSAQAPAALAQPAVAGLLRLSIAGHTNPHRLLLLLTDITGNEPAEALERLPILLGIAHDHYQDPDLLTALTRLENQVTLSATTRADASYELALAALQRALRATDRATTEHHLRHALQRLTDLDRIHEARLDARAYAAAIEAVLAFADLEQQPSSADLQARVSAAADRLDATLTQTAAWTARLHQLDWLSARAATQAAWSRLIVSLRTAAADRKSVV